MRGSVEIYFDEAFLNEVVNGVFVGGDGDFDGGDETPVVFILGTLFDPFFDEVLLLFGEGAIGVLGRHGVGVVKDAVDDFGVFGVAGDDWGCAFVFSVGEFGEMEGDVGFAGLGILAVAVKAVLREDGANVFVVTNFFFGAEGGGEDKEDKEKFHGAKVGDGRGNGHF